MSFTSRVALRYMRSGPENLAFSWIAWLSIVGIAIGVAAMIVVLSVINGFETELRKRFLAANAHVLVYRFPSGLVDHQQWAAVLKKDFGSELTGTSPFIHYETMARLDSLMHSMLVRGIAPRPRQDVQSLQGIVRPESALNILQDEIDNVAKGGTLPDVPGLIVGAGLLSLLEAEVGDTIELVSPNQSNFGDMTPFRVIGVYDSGLKHYDNKIGLMSLASAQRFFKMDQRVTGLEVGLKKPNDSPVIAARMQEKYNVSIKEWQSFNSSLFEAMKMERVVIGVIVALVAFVASFNILISLFVSVTHKQKDISILKSLGASNRSIVILFIQQGALIGAIGSVIGVFLALIISALLERYEFVELPDLYLLATLPITYDPLVYLSVALAGALGCVVFSIYPALVGARVTPIEGVRGGPGPV